MKSVRHIARLWAAAILIVGAGVVAAPGGVTPVHAAGLAGGGEFHKLTPARIFDSRTETSINDVAPIGAKSATPSVPTFDVQILGLGGVPADASQVLAVVVNITVTQPTVPGYLTAFGTGSQPSAPSSILNFAPNQTVPNVSIIRPGLGGDLTVGLLGASPGTAHVLIDVFGWFSTSVVPAGDGARLIPVAPSRVLDTRDGTNRTPTSPLAAGESITLPIRGVDGVNPAIPDVVPASADVTGVLLNVVGITIGPGGTDTYLSLFPESLAAGAVPTTSNVNLVPRAIKANLVFVPIGADGSVRIFNFHGSTDVVADVVGYFRVAHDGATETRAGRVVPLTAPYRTFDTRESNFGGVALGPGQAEAWSFAEFANSVAIGADAVGNQLAVIGNLTEATLSRQYASVPVSSYLTAYPACATSSTVCAVPTSSNLNTFENQTIPNMAVFTYGPSNVVNVYNLAGYVHYIFDASAVVLND